MARKKKSRNGSRPIFKLGSMRVTMSDVFEAVGSGSGGLVGGLVNQVTSGRFAGNTAQAIGGLALSFIGGKRGGQIAKGIFQKTVGDLVEDQVSNFSFGSSSGVQSPSNDGVLA